MPTPAASFTDQEREIIAHVVMGLKDDQIASRLLISEPTLSCCFASIFDKFGVSDRLELIIYAYYYGLANQFSSRPMG